MLEQHVVSVRTHIHAMTEDPSNKERLYVTNEDIVKLASIGRDTVFAVTAPQGTSLIVPDPDKTAPGQPPQYRCAVPSSCLYLDPVKISTQLAARLERCTYVQSMGNPAMISMTRLSGCVSRKGASQSGYSTTAAQA